MLTLIIREFEDRLIFFILAIATITTILLASTIASISEPNQDFQLISTLFDFLPSLLIYTTPLIFSALGWIQNYSDRKNKIDTFLVTLAVTRKKILLSKMIIGFSLIILLYTSILAGMLIILKMFYLPRFYLWPLIANQFILLATLSAACYAAGFRIGIKEPQRTDILLIIFSSAILISTVAIKGFAWSGHIFLAAFAIAALASTWIDFQNSSL